MEVYIENKELTKLYETGRSGKLRLNKTIINKFFSVIQIIDSSKDIHDIWAYPSLNFEKYQEKYSMRLNKKYRLEMEVDRLDEAKTIGKFYLLNITNHYGN